jgi:hypothetical protein
MASSSGLSEKECNKQVRSLYRVDRIQVGFAFGVAHISCDRTIASNSVAAFENFVMVAMADRPEVGSPHLDLATRTYIIYITYQMDNSCRKWRYL